MMALKGIAFGSLCVILAQSSSSSCSAPPGNGGGGAPRGACCLGDGSCRETTEGGCDGSYVGDDSTCALADCPPPSGACCRADGSCTLTASDDCDGRFSGNGTTCSEDACDLSPFTEEALARGVEYRVIFGRDDEAGSGVALIDLDGDGDADLVALGRVGDGVVGVFENDGTGHFTDRSESTGITGVPDAHGICAGDYDDDGDLDLYLTQWQQPNILLRNEGNFSFADVSGESGVGGVGYGGGCAWADYDGDGLIDVYVGNWEYTDQNFLYHNLGDGSFEEVSESVGVASAERTYQPVWFDFDGDADLDLYLSNDNVLFLCDGTSGHHNQLFRNDAGAFTDISVGSGADVCFNSMGAALGDYDRDLSPDFHLTNLPPSNFMILNEGDGTFREASAEAGIDKTFTVGTVGWGTVGFDYDHNGFEDLYVVFNNGVNRFYDNAGTFPMTDVADSLGLEFLGESYCVATGDIDGDGDLDLVLSARQTDLKIYVNNEGQKRRWVKFNVVGEGHNRGGIGTVVQIRTGDARQVRHLLFGNNYKSQNEPILHFGLDTATMVDEINVTWMGGSTRTLSNYPGNTTWTLYPPERLGDADGDGTIDATDTAALTACLGDVRPGCEMMDYDGNGTVDAADAAQQAP